VTRVKLYGTRGSLASPGADTSRYGGNTPAVEVLSDDGTLLVLDAGTGIRRLASNIEPGIRRIDILLTHLHMDHIQGLGFFAPLYNPGIEVNIWGPASSTLSLAARLSRYLSPPLFPVHLRDLPAVRVHHVPDSPFEIGSFRIRGSLVCHPGPTMGFRIETQGGAIVYLPDHEPALALPGGWRDSQWISGYDLAVRAQLLIHDAQYADEEYERCVGWGHSSYRHAFEFAAFVGAKKLVPFHHDPAHDDEMLNRLIDDAEREFGPAFEVAAGCEGSVFEV
jgi:phosphoribosyl 1,2-cyclic phosphodiesterase